MSRPLRIEFPGAMYHVTSRGDRKEDIYDDDRDRWKFLEILGDVIQRDNWICHAYCLMGNHYHLVIETPDANLAKGMRQLNGVYTQWSNSRHGRIGHIFQGRYKAILVDAQAYFLELTRYVVLNPVRAGMVNTPGEWRWSSYCRMVTGQSGFEWLATDRTLSHFSSDRRKAIQRYITFVAEGIGGCSIWDQLNRQIYLGNDEFVCRMLSGETLPVDVIDIPVAQRSSPPQSLEQISSRHTDRNKAIAAAYATGHYSYHQIARYHGLHYTSVGNIVRKQRKLEDRG